MPEEAAHLLLLQALESTYMSLSFKLYNVECSIYPFTHSTQQIKENDLKKPKRLNIFEM